MNQEINEIGINGVIYIPKTEAVQPTTDYVIVRTCSAGVFAGYIESQSEDGKRATMRNVRCLWYWDGAASLMQLASDGTCKPDKCKFTKSIDKIELMEIIETLYCTDKAAQQIRGLKSWTIE